jgi:hypothetical protein
MYLYVHFQRTRSHLIRFVVFTQLSVIFTDEARTFLELEPTAKIFFWVRVNSLNFYFLFFIFYFFREMLFSIFSCRGMLNLRLIFYFLFFLIFFYN